MKTFKIQDITFACETEKINDITWRAKIIHLYKDPNSNSENREFIANGNDEKEAIENLYTLLKKEFFFSSNSLTIKDVIYSLLKWLVGSKKWTTIVFRSLIVITILLFILLFFVNISSNSSNVLISNIRYLTGNEKSSFNKIDTGFLSEPFIKEKLINTKKVFWASGVSFRNLRDGNKNHLIDLLNKNIEFKLVLLDPNSPLGQDSLLSQFSRTAKKTHIEETIKRLMDSTSGILTIYGKADLHQLYISNLAPVIPMIRIDDDIYVSYLIHTDKKLQKNIYDGPFLKFDINSPFGSVLREHFYNLISSNGTTRLYPKQ